jgi:CHAD domain-containing protein
VKVKPKTVKAVPPPPPEPEPEPAPAPASTAPQIPQVSAYLARLLGELAQELEASAARVISGEKDDEAVHDVRVAMRRIRTLLRLARPIYGRFHADAVRRAFTLVMRASGELRDEEVLDETLDGLPVVDTSFDSWRRSRTAREKRLRRAMVERVKSGELARAHAMLVALVVLPVYPERDVPLAKFAKKVLARTQSGVDERREASVDDSAALHDLRIAYKELRYTAELFAPALPADLAATAAPAAKFQKRLGEVHDLDVALAVVAHARVLPVFARTAALEALTMQRRKKIEKYQAEMAPAEAPVLAVVSGGAAAGRKERP